MVSVQLLNKDSLDSYTSFLETQEESLFYYSIDYKDLIEDHLGCKSFYLLAIENDEVKGVSSLMIHYNVHFGNIANSLPYYGSNGGIIVSGALNESDKNIIRKALLDHTLKIINEEKCVAYTIISNPLNQSANDWLKISVPHDFVDYRIGQITSLPNSAAEDQLMSVFSDPRPRNIRKALKSGVKYYVSDKLEDIDFLYKTHKENIESINGIAKKESFFKSVFSLVNPKRFKVYIATEKDVKIGGLLLFFYGKTVEYFTPATVNEYRNLQPSSLLIYEAMKDAIKEGYKYWNWGGTWKTQSGVYDFKKKWGAEDKPYFYYTKIINKSILELSQNVLLKEYPYFYVVAFDKLNKDEIAISLRLTNRK